MVNTELFCHEDTAPYSHAHPVKRNKVVRGLDINRKGMARRPEQSR